MATKKVSQLSADQLRERWREHIGLIAEEANYMAIHRVRYRAIERWLFSRPHRRIVNRSLQAFGWISRLWLTEGLMSVRRELDTQNRVVNLRHLLGEIGSRPSVLSCISSTEVAKDLETLEAGCSEAFVYAQREIAHRALWEEAFVSVSLLDAALDTIGALVRKYHFAITGSKLVFKGLELDAEWLQAFTEPWYRPRAKKKGGKLKRSGV